ncbi:MAG TPA: cytochrome c peroxidase, partial [Fimbriimonadaceae bacterium]|nr:cytochrome c peroxidase [Fimbriimonadaceae bacterium]
MRSRLPKHLPVFACSATFLAAFFTAPPSHRQSIPPVSPPTSPNVAALGELLFNDTTLSEPGGMACVSCHDPSTGFSYPE